MPNDKQRSQVCGECGAVCFGNRPKSSCLDCWIIFCNQMPSRVVECRDLVVLLHELDAVRRMLSELDQQVHALRQAATPRARRRPRKDAVKS